MEKNVIITIVGGQKLPEDTDENLVTLVTEGTYNQKDGKYIISYDESSVTGMEETTTTVYVDADSVTMERTGKTSSQMYFKKGEKQHSYYETPFGTFTVGINLKNLDVDLNEDGGKLSLSYYLDIASKVESENSLNLTIRQA